MLVKIALLVCFAALVAAQTAGGQARLVVTREFLNYQPVQNEISPITIRIFNTGSAPAFDVLLNDEKYDSSFERALGIRSASWDKLAAGANVSHTHYIRAKDWGKFGLAAAQVTYKRQPNGPTVTLLSSTTGIVEVTKYDEVARRNSSHAFEWGIFTLIALLPILLPYFSLSNYNNNFSNGIRKGSGLYKVLEAPKKKKQ